MSNLPCNKNASKYIIYFGKNSNAFNSDELNSSQINATLNDILKHVNDKILTRKYDSFEHAKQNISHDANQLINLVHMYNVYVTQCKDSSFTKILKNHMCLGYQVICKTYHLMHVWSLMLLDCLYFQSDIKHISNITLAKAKIHIQNGDKCIKTLQSKNNLELAKQLLTCANHLRKNFKHYCDKKIDINHKIFIKKIEETLRLIESKFTETISTKSS